MTFSVGAISAVRVRLSLGQGQVQVALAVTMGVSKVMSDAVDTVSITTAGPHETKANRIKKMGNNKKMLGNILFMMHYLPTAKMRFVFNNDYIKNLMCTKKKGGS